MWQSSVSGEKFIYDVMNYKPEQNRMDGTGNSTGLL